MRIRLNHEVLTLDPSGALWWDARRTLVLADIHFEKGSSYARYGLFLPPYDSRAMLTRIARLQQYYQPQRVIALGDSFHDAGAEARLGGDERADLEAIVGAQEWIWIAGNHDPRPPAWLNGRFEVELEDGNLLFRHDPSLVASAGEIAGHLHPCHTIHRQGRAVRRRCFVSDGLRLVMPAFGAYAGGLDLRDDVFIRMFPASCRIYMLGAERVYAVA
ncbi:MAG: ligase-associated DNA damage response endonuclease PdeM [Alphaproteobacteria bacterium]|nr:ligase-associated DNA damage response endonuclease PdeM [Alphaproteobacteria bacterium]